MLITDGHQTRGPYRDLCPDVIPYIRTPTWFYICALYCSYVRKNTENDIHSEISDAKQSVRNFAKIILICVIVIIRYVTNFRSSSTLLAMRFHYSKNEKKKKLKAAWGNKRTDFIMDRENRNRNEFSSAIQIWTTAPYILTSLRVDHVSYSSRCRSRLENDNVKSRWARRRIVLLFTGVDRF